MTDRERKLLELLTNRVVELCCYVGWEVYGRQLNDALADMRREAERENAENAR